MNKSFYKHKLENLINVTDIITIHDLNYDKDYRFLGEKHDFWELVYCKNNQVICSTEREPSIELNAGDIIFHEPKEFHAIRANGSVCARIYVISFECKSEAVGFFTAKKFKLKPQLAEYLDKIIDEAKKTFILPRFKPELRKLELLRPLSLGGKQLIRTYLEQVLVLCLRDLVDAANAPLFVERNNSDRLADNIKRYIIDRIDEKIDLKGICDEFYFSKTYICRTFKRETGMTVNDFVLETKIKRAKSLLKQHKLSITEISAQIGFSSSAYFSSVFKNFVGLTPEQYKNNKNKGVKLYD